METMNLHECYRLLEVKESSTDEEVVRAYKSLATKYHPDKNPRRLQWAHEMMTSLNNSYGAIMAHRFKAQAAEDDTGPEERGGGGTRGARRRPARDERAERFKNDVERDVLIGRFVKNRESTKEALYKYFQYNLYNLARREQVLNRGTFNEVVFSIRKNYHAIRSYLACTADEELIEHFTVFSDMIFNFYRASECLNILESYSNQTDVQAYRQYKKGDDALHIAHKEIFYDRHNRGNFKKDVALAYLMKADDDFRKSLRNFPDSTWAVETQIKLDYSVSLRKYLDLFFSE